MAAPTIPPIRVGLIGTGLAVEKLHWPALCRLTEGAIGNYTASHPEISVPPVPNEMRLYGTEGVLAGSNGYRAELVDFADAVQFGVRPVGSVAQSVANAMVVQRALDSAVQAAVLALGQRISSSASFAA